MSFVVWKNLYLKNKRRQPLCQTIGNRNDWNSKRERTNFPPRVSHFRFKLTRHFFFLSLINIIPWTLLASIRFCFATRLPVDDNRQLEIARIEESTERFRYSERRIISLQGTHVASHFRNTARGERQHFGRHTQSSGAEKVQIARTAVVISATRNAYHWPRSS